MICTALFLAVFFFNDTATTEIYTLSLHDALPIWAYWRTAASSAWVGWKPASSRSNAVPRVAISARGGPDRKSTRLNSSHGSISYAVFCLKKKKKHKRNIYTQTDDSTLSRALRHRT